MWTYNFLTIWKCKHRNIAVALVEQSFANQCTACNALIKISKTIILELQFIKLISAYRSCNFTLGNDVTLQRNPQEHR